MILVYYFSWTEVRRNEIWAYSGR